MKNLSKLIFLSLFATFLSSCTANQVYTDNTSAAIGDSTSITDSVETSESPDSSDGEEIVINLTENEDENWLKAPEGFEGFTYKRGEYRIINKDQYEYSTPWCISDGLPFPVEYEEYIEPRKRNKIGDEFIYIKASVAGESFQVYNYTFKRTNEGRSNISGVITPIFVEEIIDDFGNTYDFEKGDIIYTGDSYSLINDDYIAYYDEFYDNTIDFSKEEDSDYQYALQHTQDNSIHVGICYPMEKGKSYLVLIGSKKTKRIDDPISILDDDYDELDNISIYENAGFFMNLSDDEPDSYGEMDKYLDAYYNYETYWHACKELYGEYFE